MKRKLPHLRIDNSVFFNELPFTTSRSGRGSSRYPDRKPQKHSNKLSCQLKDAWENAKSIGDKLTAVGVKKREGIYLEFFSEPGFDLKISSLENNQGKEAIKLLNTRFDEHNKQYKTTIFVPWSRQDFFLDKVKRYADPEKNNNKNLISSISEIYDGFKIESFWQSSPTSIPGSKKEWCEIWLRDDQVETQRDNILANFQKFINDYEIRSNTGHHSRYSNEEFKGCLKFPDRLVKLVYVNRHMLLKMIRHLDSIAEIRLAAQVPASFFIELPNNEQYDFCAELLERVRVKPSINTSICILDTGINKHPLLKDLIVDGSKQAYLKNWGVSDHNGHGTAMAGVSAYGNLIEAIVSKEIIDISHSLESVKILPPNNKKNIEPRLWGDVVKQAVYLSEIEAPHNNRIHCMAVTSTTESTENGTGRPSSWSAAIDQICFGRDNSEIDEANNGRLFIISAGNAVEYFGGNFKSMMNDQISYPQLHKKLSVHDPGQSWNAITVGAYTQLDNIDDPTYSAYKPVASKNELSPHSTTSCLWNSDKPNKPDILMEGGNLAVDSEGDVFDGDDLAEISTYWKHREKHFDKFCMTSGSCAKAAWFAAKLQANYPEYWPETIRGLIIHSASWPKELMQQFGILGKKKTEYANLLKIAGYGIPSLEKALYSAQNSLTLISQNVIQPYKIDKSDSKTKEMHQHELPWPKETLEAAGDLEIQMRVTLSYFIEPGPGEVGRDDRYLYPSHGLRFDLKSPTETLANFQQRLNKHSDIRKPDFRSDGSSSASKWLIGQARDSGTVISDIWKGNAAELAESNFIAIFPVQGWWRKRKHLNKVESKCRYSLIVSIESEKQELDLYTQISNIIETKVTTEIQPQIVV